jgi:hypothetical protein
MVFSQIAAYGLDACAARPAAALAAVEIDATLAEMESRIENAAAMRWPVGAANEAPATRKGTAA